MFSKGGGEALAKTCDVPFLGKGTLKYYKSGPLFWGHLWDYDKCPLNGHVPLIELTMQGLCVVEPTFRGHTESQDQEKCPVNGDVPSIEANAKWNLHSGDTPRTRKSVP